ncbi:MAG: anion permease [Bryobacteraceae bacterium]|nr:anion permease [Bryobacteraceae bacterium]
MAAAEIPQRQTLLRLASLVAIYLFVTLVLPRPESVTPAGWRLTGLFAATVAGLVIQPLPGGALVLLAITLAPLLTDLQLQEALAGYADSTVWLVMAAFFISRALLNTGLARRIALLFVRAFGNTSLGVCYALSLSDMVLASVIPSNAARSGGVILPIARSIAELYGSLPGDTARRLGAFLMVCVYQCVVVSCAMFYTGQASNPLAARMAGDFGFEVTWAGWFAAGLVPGLLSIAIVPLVIYRLNRPEITRTPEAAAFASSQLHEMGPLKGTEKILTGVFVAVCGLWITSGWHGLDITITALCGSMALLLTGVLKWDDVLRERAAWDIFLWYGGLLRLGRALNDEGVTRAFAQAVGDYFSGLSWMALLLVALLIFFYSHYAFASITAHILSMYPAFLALLAAKGAPLGLVVFSFASFANLSAGLTNYGTTPAPMFYGHGYVPLKDWWKAGAVASVVNIAIWLTAGFAWWKLLGLW